jgi:hypothetical protein
MRVNNGNAGNLLDEVTTKLCKLRNLRSFKLLVKSDRLWDGLRTSEAHSTSRMISKRLFLLHAFQFDFLLLGVDQYEFIVG